MGIGCTRVNDNFSTFFPTIVELQCEKIKNRFYVLPYEIDTNVYWVLQKA